MQKLLINAITLLLLAVPLLTWSHAGNNNPDAIHACVSKKQFRIVNVTKACAKREKALHWNITGPQGNPGAPGLAGSAGATGPQGPAAPVHFIGESYGGGIVFFVYDGGQHGLIAARADQNGGAGIQWYNGVLKLTGTTGDGIGAGAMNTALIVATQLGDNVLGNFAAKVAADYSVQADGASACTGSATETCYGDWYLPSKSELNLLFQQRGVVGGFAGDFYWSSTEFNTSSAWFQTISNGNQIDAGKIALYRVRAVRAF